MRKLIAVLAALMFAAPAFAAVQNVKVSGDIDATYISRNHFNLGKGIGNNIVNGPEAGLSDQNDFISQTRVRIDADLSDNVSTAVGLINERAWDAEASSNTDIQLYLAYATLREFLYSPLSVTVGRQVFAYGNGLIIGDGGANNVATGNLATVAADLTKRSTYDGVKAVLDYKPLTLDLIYFRNNSGPTTGTNTGSLSAARDNDDVFGINANYQLGDAMNTVVEGYFFGRKNDNTFNTTTKADTIYVPGLRVSTNPIKGLNTQVELAWQAGSKAVTADGGITGGDNIRREAMAAQFMATYEVPAMEKYKPVASASYTYISGDKNGDLARPTTSTGVSASGETYGAWDPMFEAQGGGTIYNTLLD